jgi:hypothetical protein
VANKARQPSNGGFDVNHLHATIKNGLAQIGCGIAENASCNVEGIRYSAHVRRPPVSFGHAGGCFQHRASIYVYAPIIPKMRLGYE